MSIMLGFDEVCRLLPQDHPFIMVDRVDELEPGKRIVCRKNVSGNEWMFPAHFPGKALFPGVLLIEGIAQAAILLFRGGAPSFLSENTTYLLASVKARFLKPVVPGDQILYLCEAVKFASTGGAVEAVASVDGETVVKADLIFAIQNERE